MTVRLLNPDQIRALSTASARARALRAYFDADTDMRRLRDQTARQLRAEGATVAEVVAELGCSPATVKVASRLGVDS